MNQTLSSSIAYQVRDGIARVVLTRPEVANVFDLPMAQAFADAVWQAGSDRAVRVVLVSGEGRDFCLGSDVASLVASEDRSSYLYDLARVLDEGLQDLAEIEKPVIAAIQGTAAAAGLAIVLAADVVLSSPEATFQTGAAGVGLTPDCGLSWELPRVVGPRRALELALTGRVLSAGEAQDWGLVTTVVDHLDIHSAADSLAACLATAPPFALGHTRRLIRSAWAESRAASGADEARTISRAVATPEARVLVERLANH